jgi:hypothetical protein
MRRLWPSVFLLLLPCGSASAQPYDLDGGALIVHQVPEFAYTIDPPTGDWCTSYMPHAIDSCDAQINRVDPAGATRVVWFVLAAWHDAKTWCGTEFGLGDFDPALFAFEQYGPCFPTDGLSIPTAGWPGPRTGIALAVTGPAWSGNYLPVYYFTGYAYDGPGVIPLAPSPTSGFAGTANCLTPPRLWPAAALGGLGIGTDGIFACPPSEPPLGCCWVGEDCILTNESECELMGGIWVPPLYCSGEDRRCGGSGPPRVCCIHDECVLMVEQQCADAGGVYHANWSDCQADPCVERHVCCLGELCQMLSWSACVALGGTWHITWDSCGPPNPCAEPHVCCLGETCRLLTNPDDCAQLQGVWHPEWSSCSGNPCDTLPPMAACCAGADCSLLTESDCLALGGIWMSTWLSCAPNQCPYLPPPPHVCCVGEQCVLVQTGLECHTAGGFLHPWSPDCDPDPCAGLVPGCCWLGAVCQLTTEIECMAMGGIWVPPDYCFAAGRDCGGVGLPRLCCISDRCYFLVEGQCTDAGGAWHPEWDSCDPNPCGGSVPAEKWSWGAVKALYR